MRIGVIGVGIVGASIGWHLANHGVDVVMIEEVAAATEIASVRTEISE